MSNERRSVSRLTATIEIQDNGEVECEFIRHLAPFTINQIFNALPISGLVHLYNNKFAYIQTNLNVGNEKQRTSFKPGHIGFLTSTSSICFFLQDCSIVAMNMLGNIKSDTDLLSKLKLGTTLTLKK